MKNISVETLKEYQAEGRDYFLIDVREACELEDLKMEGMPFNHFPMSDFEKYLDQIPTDKEIVVFCKLGGRSAKIAELLETKDFDNVTNLIGGITAWSQD